MTEFVNAWKNYVNFSDRTSVRGYWMAFLFFIITAFVVGIIAGLTTLWISYIWSLAILLPSLALAIRRLRDAGKAWYWIFINLIPLVGFIIYIVMLCKPSIPDNGVPQV
jgi:uncharacterized membrane protein YhaH (DUF805 family)